MASLDAPRQADPVDQRGPALNAAAPLPGPLLAPLLELCAVSKQFPGVKALDKVSLEIYPGEVHMVLGQNGAGKSSLMKVLYGAYHADEGEIRLRGERVRIASPSDARRLGIAIISQEFTLVPHLNLAQNIFLGRQPVGRFIGKIDHATMHRRARELLDALGLSEDTMTPAHKLGVAQQQLVEIAKALSQNARVLVMDEPSSALSDHEVEKLFGVIRRLQSEGVAIIYISHRMAEVFQLGDRITVLRDGRRVASLLPSETTPQDLVKMMIGRSVDAGYRTRFCAEPGAALLEVRGLCAANGTKDVSLVVRAGEIVGLSGLVGSGRSELVRAIFGADTVTGGELELFGAAYRPEPAEAVRRGLALVPESRKQEGLLMIHGVADNLIAAGLKILFPRGWYRAGVARRAALALIARMKIATPNPERVVKTLSGGNQHKVVIGKWLCAQSRCFIFDEPTRGIDVGAKAEIFALIEQLVDAGSAVLMISSELPEIVALCDRSYVMREGRIVGELARDELSEANILHLAMHPESGHGEHGGHAEHVH